MGGGGGKGERRGGKTPGLRRYCYSNEAGSWMKPPWPAVCVGLRLSPCPSPSIQNCLASCECLFIFGGEKKGLPNTKGKKTYRMEGIKGVKLPWCFARLQFCKLGFAMGQCRGCWMERNNSDRECFCYGGCPCDDPVNEGTRCYLYTWNPVNKPMSPLENNLFRPF